MKLTINRNKWLQGEGHIKSSLLRKSDNKMCCLGFLAKTCGAQDKVILEVENPSYFVSSHPRSKAALNEIFLSLVNENNGLLENSDVCSNLMMVNDSIRFSKPKRESRIKELFKKINVDVEFVGEYGNA